MEQYTREQLISFLEEDIAKSKKLKSEKLLKDGESLVLEQIHFLFGDNINTVIPFTVKIINGSSGLLQSVEFSIDGFTFKAEKEYIYGLVISNFYVKAKKKKWYGSIKWKSIKSKEYFMELIKKDII